MKRALLASIFAAVFAIGFSVAVAPDAFAQGKTKSSKTKKAKAKKYDFTGDDIDGDLVRPDGLGINAREFLKHTSLIKLRTNFVHEILKSAERI